MKATQHENHLNRAGRPKRVRLFAKEPPSSGSERRLVRCVDCQFGKINNGEEVRCSVPKPLPPEVIRKTTDFGWTLASSAADCPHFHPANAEVSDRPL